MIRVNLTRSEKKPITKERATRFIGDGKMEKKPTKESKLPTYTSAKRNATKFSSLTGQDKVTLTSKLASNNTKKVNVQVTRPGVNKRSKI